MGLYNAQSVFSALIWKRCWSILGFIVILWVHAVTSGPCLFGDFDTQVKHLLQDEMLTRAEIANLSTVFPALQQTLQTQWPGSEVIPLGSFVTGLASKTSDADCMVTVPRHHVMSETQLVLQAGQMLTLHPHLYDRVQPKVHPTRRIALLKFNYIPTQTNCDVNFISDLALHNTKMMSYYFSLDDIFLALAAILKYWAKVQGLRSTKALATNSLNLLIIFYLQQENFVPPFGLLQRRLFRCPKNVWETNFESIRYKNTNTPDLYQLLGGFFKYYSKFDFNEYVVSPLLGYPIRKREFEDIESLPEELSLYKNYMRNPYSKPLAFNKKMCVQDAIEQRRNTAEVSEEKANTFISLVRYSARMFEVVPRDRFLLVILNGDGTDNNQRDQIIKDYVNATDYINKNK